MAGPNTTPAKKHIFPAPSYSTTSKGRPKVSRRVTKAAVEPKMPSTPLKSSQKRPRSNRPRRCRHRQRRNEQLLIRSTNRISLRPFILKACPVDNWWRVTPDSAKKNDVCVDSRLTWANVLPVFVEANLLRTKSIDWNEL